VSFTTECPFELPKGYVDPEGQLHARGVMRLATAADEIYPMKDPRVQDLPAYLIVVLLARVVTKLGTLPQVDPGVIEGLFAEDLTFLQELYNRINAVDAGRVPATCPDCGRTFEVEAWSAGGS
jgi:hypothetical protein